MKVSFISAIPAKSLATVLTIALSSTMVLTGCQATKGFLGKRDNGSLAYQKSEHLKPLTLPAEQQTAPFVPLYPIVEAGENTLPISNEAGKQYKLPPPQRILATPATN